jgi:quinol monooxygenase YgiN
VTAKPSRGFSALSLGFTIKPGQRDKLLEEIRKVHARCVEESDFVYGVILESEQRPYEIRLFEIWKGSEADFARTQSVKPYRVAFLKYVQQLVSKVEVEWNTVTQICYPTQ